MMRINISQQGKKLDQILIDISKKEAQIYADIRTIVNDTKNFMVQFINTMRSRPLLKESKLCNAISMEENKLPNGVLFGIGNINKLNSEAVYWRVINYGSYHIVGLRTIGYFYPGTSKPDASHFREGRWVYVSGSGNYLLQAKNPIPPMNYIENSINYLNSKLNAYTKI